MAFAPTNGTTAANERQRRPDNPEEPCPHQDNHTDAVFAVFSGASFYDKISLLLATVIKSTMIESKFFSDTPRPGKTNSVTMAHVRARRTRDRPR